MSEVENTKRDRKKPFRVTFTGVGTFGDGMLRMGSKSKAAYVISPEEGLQAHQGETWWVRYNGESKESIFLILIKQYVPGEDPPTTE